MNNVSNSAVYRWSYCVVNFP